MHFFLRLPRALPWLAILLTTGCGSWSNPIDKISPYRIDIQQGNALTQDMVDKLKPGMTPAQVRFVLGTPLVVDPFHKDRWDYVYRLEKAGKLVEHRRITVVFENERLKGLEGDVAAAAPKPAPGQEAAAAAPAAKQEDKK